MIPKADLIVTVVFTIAPFLVIALLDWHANRVLRRLDREHPLPTPEEVKRHFKL